MKAFTKTLILLAACFFFFSGCRLQDKSWDMKILVPLAHADITIGNLVGDSTVKKNADNTLTLVHVQTLKSLNISDLLKVPDTTFEKTVSLKKIELGTRTMSRDITLGTVAKSLGLAGLIIVSSNGKKVVVPPFNNLSTGSNDINATSFFQTATFIDGTLELSIHNGFPIELTDIKFQLDNKNNGQHVIIDSIASLLPGASFDKAYNLAGKTVDGNMVANITSMNTPGSNGDSVLIDTSNAISMVIKGYNMHVFSATAIFPAQNVVDDKVDVNYNLNGPQFKSFIIKEGMIKFRTKSTIKDSLHLHYSIPGTVKNGSPISEDMVVPPASGGAQLLLDSFSLAGYNTDLTGQNHDTFNTFYNILQVHLDSTGKLESLSLADSIYIYYGLLGVVPGYAKGYLGTKQYEIGPESSSFDFFNNIKADKITIPQLKVNLQVSNGVGASAVATIKSLTAYNSKTGKSLALTSSAVINKPLVINPATDNPLKPTITSIQLDNTNSNINNLLELLPDKFLYQMEVTIDPNGNSSNYNDFIYYESAIKADLDIEMPLQFGAQGIVLQDTLKPDFGTNLDISRVEDGVLHVNVANDYPIEARMQLYIIDQNNIVTDSLIKAPANLVPAGNGDPNLPQPGKGTINVSISNHQWQQLLDKKKLVLKATLNTANMQVVTIYSNSHLRAGITGDFRYRNTLQ